jgi:hypothetical protein
MKPRDRNPTTEADARLKNLLSQVDELPAEQRSNLAEFLEALLKIHRYLDTQSPSTRPHKPKKT